MLLKSPAKGFFVDVGAGCDPGGIGSNSLMFEQRGWEGIAIDGDPSRLSVRDCRTCKPIACFIGDGTNDTRILSDVLAENGCPELVDYLSIDIEGNDFKAVKAFIDCGYSFKVATIEHNLYSRNPGVDELKRDIFDFLSIKGYVRIVDNAGHMAVAEDLHRGWPFEDWYINPKHINYRDAITKIKSMKEKVEVR